MSQYDRIKKRADAKALQNRQKRAQRKANQYNDGKLNKTQQKYVAGDIVSSASTRAYGYKKFGIQGDSYITEKGRSKKNQAKINRGENPYELKYVYDGKERTVPGGTRADGSTYGSFKSRKRKLTDEEKEVYKKTGDINIDKYKKNYEYSIMSSYNKKPKKFRDNLNTNKWDGMKVAKNKGGGFNYVAGFAKDVVLDPVIDVMRGADYLSGIATGALAGGIEESKNVIEALATGDKSKVDFKRPIKNVKESIQSSNKTGWAKGMGDYFNDATKRNDKKEIERIKNNKNMTDAHKQKLIDDLNAKTDSKGHQMFRNIAGFIGDLAMPVDVGAGIGRLIKGTTTNASKSFKEMVNGTGDISTAFTPDKGRMQEALNKFAERRKNVKPSDGKFINEMYHETKPMNDLKIYDEDNARRLRNTLDNGYDLQMANDVKKTIKSNPTTQKLGQFLEKIESIGKSPVVDEFETIFEASDVPNSKLGKEIFFKKIDNLPDNESDEILDWLAEYNPKIYDEYLSASDDVSRFTDDNAVSNFIKDSYTKKYDEGRVNDLNYNLAKPSHIKNKQLNELYNKRKLESVSTTPEKYTSTSRLPVKDLKKRFSDKGQEFANNLPNYDIETLESLSKTLNNMSKNTSNIKASKIIDELNRKIFGANVIRNNLPISGLQQIVEHLEDLVNYNIAKKSGKFKVDIRTKDGIKTHYLIDRNGNPNPLPNQFHLLSPSATDEMFDKKLSDIATYFGVKNKKVFTEPLKKYEKLLKDGTGLSPEQYNEYMKLKSHVDEWGKMYKKVKNLDYDAYNDYAKKNYKNSNLYEQSLKDTFKDKRKLTYDDFYNETIDELKGTPVLKKYIQDGGNAGDLIKKIAYQKYESYRDEMNNYKLKEHINNRNVSIKEDGMLSQSPRVEQENLNEVGEVLDLSKKERFDKQTLELRNKLKLPVVESTKAKIKLSKGQKLRDIPPVKESLKYLRSTIEKELDMMYKNSSEYEKVKDSFTQIKKDYVNALRSYGVPDDKYFHKVKSLQDDLKMYYKELQKPSSIIKKDGYKPSVGKPREGIRMNLQLLAEKISNIFDEIDNNVIDDVVESDNIGSGLHSNLKPIDNGNFIDTSTGEVVYKNKKDIARMDKIAEDNKYIHKNEQENEMIAKFMQNVDKKSIHDWFFVFDRMNIKFDPSNEKSVEKAFERFDYIYNKKRKKGEIPNDIITRTENTPIDDLASKVSENKELGINNSFEEKKVMDRKFYELIDEIKQADTRRDKEALYTRLMQQSEHAYKEGYGLNYLEELSDYLMNDNGLNQLEKNKIINFMKQEQIKLANKGLDPYTQVDSNLKNSMNKSSYSLDIEDNFDKATQMDKERKMLDEKIKNRKKTPLDNVDKKNKRNLLEEIKSDKEKGITRSERRRKVRMNEIAREIQEKNKFGEVPKPKHPDFIKESTLGTEDVVKSADKLLEDDLSIKEITSTLKKDLDNFEKDVKKQNSSFNKVKDFFTDTENTHMKYEDSKVYDIYKSWLNSWKKGLTVYNPGWHVQNFFQNKGQNYLALGSDAFGSQKDARNILKEIKGESNKANYIVDKKNWKAYSPQELAKLAVDNNVVDGLGEDIQNARGILRPIENAIDNSGLMKLLNKSEETARLHHFIKQLERGMSPEEASKSVNKYLFDYGKKSKFDKVMSDFVDPFWVFHKNNARLLTQASLENPGKAANIIRATNELENGLKDEDKNSKKGDKYQSLVGSFEDDVNGDTYDYLYKENILPSVDDAIPLGRDELETKFNPLIKIALEQSRGEGAFGNKIVDKEKAGWNEVTKDERLLEIVKDLNFVGNPLVKAVSDSNKRQEQADEGKQSQETSDKQILLDWIKYITGNKGNYYRNSR